MKIKTLLALAEDGGLWLKTRPGRGREVCTVAAACAILGRTRRQVYRYIRDGVLEPRAKILGEWLLDKQALHVLARYPPAVQPLPGALQGLFPEYDLRRLNAGRDRVLVVGRVLEAGGREALRWLARRYSKGDIARFIEEDGARLLSPRSLRLWCLVFGARPRALPDWRTTDPWRARA